MSLEIYQNSPIPLLHPSQTLRHIDLNIQHLVDSFSSALLHGV